MTLTPGFGRGYLIAYVLTLAETLNEQLHKFIDGAHESAKCNVT
jgi:hypothetical protein